MAKAKKKKIKPAKKSAAPKKAVTKKPAPKKIASKKAAAKKPVARKNAPATKKKSSMKAKATPKAKVAREKKANSAKKSVPLSKKGLVDLSDFVTPLDDRVIVQLVGPARVTAGGLFIPDNVSDVSGNLQGTIVAVGRGHRDNKGRLRPMDVRYGDRVVFSSHTGSKIKMQNEELIILRESELMGVVS